MGVFAGARTHDWQASTDYESDVPHVEALISARNLSRLKLLNKVKLIYNIDSQIVTFMLYKREFVNTDIIKVIDFK